MLALIPLALGLSFVYAQSSLQWQTAVAPLPMEEILHPCEYRMTIPSGSAPVQAAWVIFDRGLDYLTWYEDRQVRAFAAQHRLALVLAAHCRSKEREDMNVLPEKGLGRALFKALDQLAELSAHPEITRVGIIAMGWSGAGSLVGRLAGYRPSRYLAGIAFAPGQYEPLGMNTIELSSAAMSRPQLIIANSGDPVNGTERPYGYFRKFFERGAPWTFLIQNRLPHCCLQNAQPAMLEWLRAVLSWGKTAEAFGYLTIEPSDVVDEWKRPAFHAKSARIGARGRARRGELPAGRLPSPDFAREWLTLVSKPLPLAVWKP